MEGCHACFWVRYVAAAGRAGLVMVRVLPRSSIDAPVGPVASPNLHLNCERSN